MRRSWRAWLCVVVCAATPAAACYSSGAVEGDARTEDRGDASGDVERDDMVGDGADREEAASEDAAFDAAGCLAPQHWTRRALEIQRLEDASDGAVTPGQAARVAAWVNLGPPGCSELGRVRAWKNVVDRVATVLVEGWINEDALAGACPPSEPMPVYVVLDQLTSGTWTVLDGSVGPTGDPVTMTLDVARCDVDCGCLGGPVLLPEGSECRWDCECDFGLECIGYRTVAGVTARACHRTCNSVADCPPFSTCSSRDDGPTAICAADVHDVCGPEPVCPPGWSCDCRPLDGPCGCVPEEATGDGGSCCRDEDCGEGLDCLQTVEDAGSFCGVRCAGDRGCASGSCGAGGTPVSSYCVVEP
jgi:hypothetical protein